MPLEPRKRLGRGLDALLAGFPEPPRSVREPIAGTPEAPVDARTAALADIRPNPRNPRRDFQPDELEELARSLKQHGLVQPIVVRRSSDGDAAYEIVAGERRWRAAQLAGLHDVPISIVDVSDRTALELAIVENVQRADLNPVEEARGYQALIDEFGYTQNDLGEVIGKSRVHVTNTLRLLKLPEAVLAMLGAGQLSAGHARALIGAAKPTALAEAAVTRGLSVRETEKLASGEGAPSRRRSRPPPPEAVTSDTKALERALSDSLGLFVSVRYDGEGRGEVAIRYSGLDQLDELCRKLQSL